MRVTNRIFTELKNLKDVQKVALSFSGCGFLGAYNFGAAKRLTSEKEKVWNKVERVAGASAGSLVASILVLSPEKLDAAIETLYSMADHVHSKPFGAMTPGYYLNEQLVKIIDDYLPTDIQHAHGRLHISITKLKSWENIVISEFESRDHLISCLLASCYIPMYSMGYRGVPPVINAEECIDGGMTNNLPKFSDMPTITCSPFSSQADICPEDSTSWNLTFANQVFKASSRNLYRGARALFPPTRKILQQYYQMGYDDADRFFDNSK